MRYPYFHFPKPTKQTPFINFYYWLEFFDSKIEVDNAYYTSKSSNIIDREYFDEQLFPPRQIINRQNEIIPVSEYERDLYIDLRKLLESSLLKVNEKIGLVGHIKKQQFILNWYNEILRLESLLSNTKYMVNYVSFKIILEDLKYEIEKLSKFISSPNLVQKNIQKRSGSKKKGELEINKIEWAKKISQRKKNILFKNLSKNNRFIDENIGFLQFDKLFNGNIGNGKKIVWKVRSPKRKSLINRRLLLYLLDQLKLEDIIKNFDDDQIDHIFKGIDAEAIEDMYFTRKDMDSRKGGNKMYNEVDDLVKAVKEG